MFLLILNILKKEKNGYATEKNICYISKFTSIGHIKLDSKVSARATGVVARRENDSTDGFDLPDDAGNSRCGQEAIVADNQPADLNGTYNNEDGT